MLTIFKNLLFGNKTVGQTLVKNTTWLFIGEILGRLIRFWIVVYAARVLGAAEYGVFSYALTIAAFATIFADIGISALLTRETSKAPELRQRYFNAMLLVKFMLIAVVAVGIFVITPLITNITGAIALIPLIIAMFSFDSLREFGFGMHRSLEKMELEAITKIVMNAFITGLGFLALYYSKTAHSLSFGYALGAFAGCVMTAWLLRRFIVRLREGIDLKLIWPMIKLAWPLGILQLLGAIMINTDMVMLGWWQSPEQLGYYGAAQKIILLLYVAPNLLASAIFPLFSRLANTANDSFRVLFEKSVAASELIAMPLAAGGIALAPQLIQLLFGAAYLPGSTTLALLMGTLIIVFPSTIFSNALFAYNKQKMFMGFVGLGVISNVILDALLIPRYGIAGSAVATIISQILANVFVWRAMQQTNRFNVIKRLRRIIPASILTGLLAYGLAYAGLAVLPCIATAAAFYFLLLYALKEPLIRELKSTLRPSNNG